MADISAMNPSNFFKSWEAARLANKDLKPKGTAGLKQAELIWRKWLTSQQCCASTGAALRRYKACHSSDTPVCLTTFAHRTSSF